MRIRVIQEPSVMCIDGVRLDTFIVGQQYEVGSRLGALFLCEGWAEPVDDPGPALVIPLQKPDDDRPEGMPPRNLVREFWPPYYDAPVAASADRRRKRRYRPT